MAKRARKADGNVIAKRTKTVDPSDLFYLNRPLHYARKRLFVFSGVYPPNLSECASLVYGYNSHLNVCSLNPMITNMAHDAKRIFTVTQANITVLLRCLDIEDAENIAVSLFQAAKVQQFSEFTCRARCHTDNVSNHQFEPRDLVVAAGEDTCRACARFMRQSHCPATMWAEQPTCKSSTHFINVYYTVADEELQFTNSICHVCMATVNDHKTVSLNRLLLYLRMDDMKALEQVVLDLLMFTVPGSLMALAFEPEHVLRAGRLAGLRLLPSMVARYPLRPNIETDLLLDAMQRVTGLSYAQLCQLQAKGYLYTEEPSAQTRNRFIGTGDYLMIGPYLTHAYLQECIRYMLAMLTAIGRDPDDHAYCHTLCAVNVTANMKFAGIRKQLTTASAREPVRLVLHAGHTLTLHQVATLLRILMADSPFKNDNVLIAADMTLQPNPLSLFESIDPADQDFVESVREFYSE